MANTTYLTRRQYGDVSIDTIRKLICEKMQWNEDDLKVASDHLDMREATDLVYIPVDTRVAVRCRRPDYIGKYFGQFTIRTSGDPSERDKLTGEFVPHNYMMFYCFMDEDGKLRHWWLINLLPHSAFKLPIGDFGNGTDSSFAAYMIVPSTVIASSEPYPYNVPPSPKDEEA